METVFLNLREINPFDATHGFSPHPPGFWAVEDNPGYHFNGAVIARDALRRGDRIRPIAVCRSELVPAELRHDRPWQRLDGFKRYWGHYMAGATEIECIVYDHYVLGPQHGQPMLTSEEEMGKILQVLAKAEYKAAEWPYQGRLQIEDCETIHVHLGHLRMEFNHDQFLTVADKFTEAAETLRRRRGPTLTPR